MILERLPGGIYISLAEKLNKVIRKEFPDNVPVHVLAGATVAMTLTYSADLPRNDELTALGEMVDVLLARMRELQH
jgi:hypothetical protein